MAVVKDYYDGNTRIKIDNESCVKTKEEIDAILKRVGKICLNYIATITEAETKKTKVIVNS